MPLSQSGRCLGLDLLRAGAVSLVLVSHWTGHFGYWFGFDAPRAADIAGDIGVEVFFALSGFLIGRILIGILRDRPDWRDYRVFMVRRAMRTLPLYFLWLALLLTVFPPRQDALVTALRCLTLTQNLFADLPADYYFAVTWSLTIEEWFYLLFAALLVALARRIGGPSALILSLATFILVPLALRLGWLRRGPLVFFRIDEIAYGVLAAVLFANQSRVFDRPRAALASGLALLGAALTGILPIPAPYDVPLTANAEIIGAALLLPSALRLTRAAGWLETPVRWIASRSYALYLTHLTILYDVAEKALFEPARLPAVACAVVAIATPFALAELSYRFVEAPMLRLRPPQDRSDRVALAAAE